MPKKSQKVTRKTPENKKKYTKIPYEKVEENNEGIGTSYEHKHKSDSCDNCGSTGHGNIRITIDDDVEAKTIPVNHGIVIIKGVADDSAAVMKGAPEEVASDLSFGAFLLLADVAEHDMRLAKKIHEFMQRIMDDFKKALDETTDKKGFKETFYDTNLSGISTKFREAAKDSRGNVDSRVEKALEDLDDVIGKLKKKLDNL